MPAALGRGEFVVEYQPMVRLTDGALTAAGLERSTIVADAIAATPAL